MKGLVRSWYHLVRRFFGFLWAGPLSPREQSEISALLADSESSLFWRQAMQDQRHGLDVARRVLIARPGDRLAARAALLHDVGKVGIGLGAIQRSLATVLDAFGVPLRGAYETYRRHGIVGAEHLQTIGADDLVVSFARHHPGPPPNGADSQQWQVLLDADHA